jgi:flagellar biosynthesis/type III secretory pathway protein FliH
MAAADDSKAIIQAKVEASVDKLAALGLQEEAGLMQLMFTEKELYHKAYENGVQSMKKMAALQDLFEEEMLNMLILKENCATLVDLVNKLMKEIGDQQKVNTDNAAGVPDN